MLDKFLWWKLEKGCLVYACMSTIYSILAFILSIFLYENFDRFEEHPMHLFLADAPEHILRLIFVFFSLIDIASSVLLVYGILKKNKFYLLPWIVTSILWFIFTLFELDTKTFAVIVVVGVCYAFVFCIFYTWYGIISLYFKFHEDEKINPSGVQLAYVEETPSTLPPYNVFIGDK